MRNDIFVDFIEMRITIFVFFMRMRINVFKFFILIHCIASYMHFLLLLLTSDVNFFPEKNHQDKKNFFSCFSVWQYLHFAIYLLSIFCLSKCIHTSLRFCPPHVYSPIANLLLTLFPYCK